MKTLWDQVVFNKKKGAFVSWIVLVAFLATVLPFQAFADIDEGSKKDDTPTFLNSSVTDSSSTLVDEADKKDNITNFPPNFCQMDVVSDTSNTLADGSPAVATYVITRESSDGVHWWTANIPGATWIWKSFYVEDSTVEDTATINKTFNIPQEISFASLSIAADNTYQVFVNGTKAYENPTEFNYFEENKGLVDIAPFLHTGSNTLSFVVKNLAQASSTPQSNPAGLLYALKVTMKGPCGTTPPPPTPPAPTVSITANPTTILTGATSTIAWVSNNATSCSASWTSATSTSGSQVVTPPSTTEYSITCVGSGGTTVASTQVTVNPIIISGCANGNELTFAEFNAAVSSQKIDYNLTVNPSNKTAVFTLNNRSGCLVPISLSVYKVFDNVLSHQKIFDGTGLVKATSTTVLSVILPDCFAQIDAWYGLYPQTLEDSNPYAYPNVPGVITYKKTNGAFCTQPATNTPPTITLLGPNPLNFIIGNTFTDPGATATDTEDGNLTNAIVSSSTVSTTTAGTYQIKYSVTDSGGLSASTTRTVVVSAPTGCTTNCGGGGGTTTPSVSLSANPGVISLGSTTTLNWTSTNTNTCSAAWTTATSTSGSQILSPSTTTTYSITCTGTNGTGGATTTVTVVPAGQPVPSITLTADPQTITTGASSTLSWTSTNTNFCSATWTSATSTLGSQSVAPTSTSEYAISCGGAFGTTTASTTVTVNTPNNGGGGNGGGGGSNNGGGSGGGSTGGRRHDISNLLSTGGTGGGEILGATSCSYLRDYMRIDWANDPVEVLKLKSFLNVFEKENLSLTTVFDQPTFDAVSRFQNKYFNDILAPWGHEAPTGFVYILTKKKVNEIYCNTVLSLTQDQKDEISSFKALLDSYRTLGGSGVGYNASGNANGGVIQAALSGAIGGVDPESPFVVELKDNSTTTNALNGASVVKNVAISLFALPQKIFNDSKNIIFFLVVLIIILILIRLFVSDSKKTVATSVASAPNLTPNKGDDSRVIELPGSSSSKKSEIFPDEEIIIDNDEEDL